MNGLIQALSQAENSRYALVRLEPASGAHGTERKVIGKAGSFWGWLVHCLKCKNGSYARQLRNDRLSMLEGVEKNKLIGATRERKVLFVQRAIDRGNRREFQRLMLELVRLEEENSSAPGGDGPEPATTTRLCNEQKAWKTWHSSRKQFAAIVGNNRLAGLLHFSHEDTRQPYKRRTLLPSSSELTWVNDTLNEALKQVAVNEPGSERARLTESQEEPGLADTQDLQAPARTDADIEREVTILSFLTVLGGATYLVHDLFTWQDVSEPQRTNLWAYCQGCDDTWRSESYKVKVRVPDERFLETFHKLDDFVREPGAAGVSQPKPVSLERLGWVKNKAYSMEDPLGTRIDCEQLFWLCSAYEEYMAGIGGTTGYRPADTET